MFAGLIPTRAIDRRRVAGPAGPVVTAESAHAEVGVIDEIPFG